MSPGRQSLAMAALREAAKFASGLTAWEAVVHASLWASGRSPQVLGIRMGRTLNIVQTFVPAVVSVALAWYAWRRPRPAPASTAGRYVHFDLVSGDPQATKAFFESAFGWTFRHVPLADYWLATAGGPPHGGLRAAEGGEAPQMRGYVSVGSLDEACRRIEAAGGRILGQRQAVPGFGAFVLFEAPGGLVQGAFQERR